MANSNKQIKFIAGILIIFIGCQCAKLQTPNTNQSNADLSTTKPYQQVVPISDTMRLLNRKWVLVQHETPVIADDDVPTDYNITNYSNSPTKESLILSVSNNYSIGINKSNSTQDSIVDYGTWNIVYNSYEKRNYISFKSNSNNSHVGLFEISRIFEIKQLDTANLVLSLTLRGGGIRRVYKSN